ncbi:hypothetical protein M407DRAFT_22908 [Tulasnella calospora MUT 4182]|uniref:Uncharacterized protein n=1 Tax=Tulasnella calospora MUT 4182 TaxID=1051891 RepID=A0A0C3QKH7_9AGAM|nr:hypothetical protein M407DRAFT_22908 [Tulasnella calospora MUT 4182]
MSNVFLSTRPPVTASDAEKLRSLWEAVPQSDVDLFEIHGYIRDIKPQKRTLLYTVELGGKPGAKVLQLDNPDTEPVGDLYKSINMASPLGGDNIQAEADPRELSRDRFSLNFNPIELDNGVLASVSAFCKIGVEAKLSCLKVMAKGDCFETNFGTGADENCAGFLVVEIPTVYEGGTLVLCKGDCKTTIDWSAKKEKQEALGLRWAFIPLGVKSQVQAITSGYRVTLNYKIFATGAVLYKFPKDRECFDVEELNLYKCLESLYHDSNFLLGGGRIALPCQYEYPTADMWRASALGKILKGSDHILWHASKKVGYEPAMRVVRKLSVEFDLSNTSWLEDVTFKAIRDQGSNRYPVDTFSSYNPKLGLVYLTSNSLRPPSSYSCMDEYSTAFQILGDEQDCASILEMDLIWAAAPKAWVKESSFVQDIGGEKGSIVHSYVAGVIILELPVYSD